MAAVVIVVLVLLGGGLGVVLATRSSKKSATITPTQSPARTPKKDPLALVNAAAGSTSMVGSAHYESRLTFQLGTAVETTIDGDLNFTSGNAQASVSQGGRTYSVRKVGDVSYIGLPGVTLPGGQHWISLSPSDLGGSTPVPVWDTFDPVQDIEYLNNVSAAPVAASGTEMVNGADTQQYQVVMDFATDLQSAQNEENKVSSAFGATFKELVDNSNLAQVPGSVWLDSAGRVRRLTYTVTLTPGGRTLTESETIDFTNYGESVSVSAPAANDTVSFSSVKGELGLGNPETFG